MAVDCADLTNSIFGASSSPFRTDFMSWCQESCSFASFAARYRDKLSHKVLRARAPEDLGDLRYEVEVAYLYSKCSDWPLSYERFGPRTRRAPDYSSDLPSGDILHMEVKRIREAEYEGVADAWSADFHELVQAIPSSLAVNLHFQSFKNQADFLAQLRDQKAGIFEFIRTTIPGRGAVLEVGEEEEMPVPGFSGLVVKLSKLPAKTGTQHTLCRGCKCPAGFTQKEFRQFGDSVVQKLGQTLPGDYNVLFISSGSFTHGDLDFREAVLSLDRLVNSQDDAFFVRNGYDSAADFSRQLTSLSAIAFRSTWIGSGGRQRELWQNPAAIKPLTDVIRATIECMIA
jgi:hypothetical protein